MVPSPVQRFPPRSNANPFVPGTSVAYTVAVGFVNFANLWVDFHMLKVSGGKVQIMQAVLSSFASADKSTGWEDQEGR